MKFNSSHIIIVLAFSITCLASCKKNFLDRQISTDLSESQVFSDNYAYIQDYLTTIYNYVPAGFDHIGGAMLSSASDNSEFTYEGSAIQTFNTGDWSSYSNPDDVWANYYAGIRYANKFLQGTKDINFDNLKYTDSANYQFQTKNLIRFRYEARFLRAYFYFELIKRYGGVPLITDVLTLQSDLNKPRNSLEECIAFIAAECDTTAANLPLKYDDPDIGRATKGAALALKSRLLLYAASPLYSKTNDLAKWDSAAKAAKAVIDLGVYSLESSYSALFHSYQSAEIIFAHRYGASNNFEKDNYSIGYQGQSGNTPTQNLVDAYEMTDGTSFDWNNPQEAAHPYENRDPRLNMSIIVNNSQWKNRPVECWTGGLDGKGQFRATKTGYYLKKYVDESIDLIQNTSSIHTWILFRLGEIYLNYAEAMNEAYGPDQDPMGYGMTAIQAINMLRNRPSVNMPPLVSGQWSKDSFRNDVHNERRVEMAFEEQRFWDVRRWNEGEKYLNAPIYGVNITIVNSSTFNYSKIKVEDRVFQTKMYFYPIPQTEIIKEPALKQNAGW